MAKEADDDSHHDVFRHRFSHSPTLHRLAIPIHPARRPAASFNRPLTESLRDSANNPIYYVALHIILDSAKFS